MNVFYKHLTPSFLKRIDHFLLTNYPVVWSTQVHFFVFYSLIVTNLAACLIGLAYPLTINNIPEYKSLFEVWKWSFAFAIGLLSFYAYLQSYAIKEVFNHKEVLNRMLIYLFCTGSVFANTLIFPNVIHYRVKQIIPKQEFYDDLYTYIFEDYRVSFWQLCYYNNSKDHMEEYNSRYDENGNRRILPEKVKAFVKYPKYQRILLKSKLNQDKQLNEYLLLCHTLDSLLPKPSPEEEQNYRRRKARLETDFKKKNPNTNKEFKYWEVYEYLHKYRKNVIKAIEKHPKWQPEFKEKLIQKIKSLPEFIFSLTEDLGAYASPLLQNRKLIALQEKYTPNYTLEKSRVHHLNQALNNIYQYHHGNLFFHTYRPGFGNKSSSKTSVEFYGKAVINQLKAKARKHQRYYFDPFSGDYPLKNRYQTTKISHNYRWSGIYLPVEEKTKIFSYYLDQIRIMKSIHKALPQEFIPESHMLQEAYINFMVSIEYFHVNCSYFIHS